MSLRISSRTSADGDVEVGLVPVEAVQVVLPGLGVERPDALLVAGEHHALRAVGGDLVGPHVEVAEPRLATVAGRLEPRVLVRRVVDDEVDDHPHAAVRAVRMNSVKSPNEPRRGSIRSGR